MPNSWDDVAERALREASEAMKDNRPDDALSATTRALAAMYRWVGEAPDTVRLQAGDLTLDPERGPECTCPRDLRMRGGYRSSCPDHGR